MGPVFTAKLLRRQLVELAMTVARRQQSVAGAAVRGWSSAARWLLLAAVIAGVLAMHVLSAADMGGNHQPTAMASVSGASPADPPSMVMDMSAAQSRAPVAQPVAGTQLAPEGIGMSAMSCCVLFLASAVGLVLLIRSFSVPTASVGESSGSPAMLSILQRGPPGPGRPRIALSVLRV
jgi:hypothetical protein